MKRTAFEKKQVDGIPSGTRADVKTHEHSESTIECGVARQRMSLLEPNAVCRRDRDQRDQKPGFPPVLSIGHLGFSL